METPHRYQETTNARFTEQFNSSPPYHQVIPDSPEVTPYDERAYSGQTGQRQSEKNWRMSGPGSPEPVWDEEGNKEVVPPRHQQHPDGLPPGLLGYRRGSDDGEGRTYCGLGRVWFFVVLAIGIIVILGIALGVGLGVGLGQNHSSSKSSTSTPAVNAQYLIGGAIDPDYYTNVGAFNGSGIALASQSFSKDLKKGTQGSIVMYFQHHSGEIRYFQLTTDGSWSGGSSSEVVAVDAKNSTPLSAVSYSIGGINSWHIFYIDQKNTIRQRSNSNTTNLWVDGPMNELNLKANDAGTVGMQACWYGNDYGDTDYTHTPLSSQNGNGNPKFSNQVGMHMWYASDSNTFQQLGWRDGDPQWAHQGSFSNMNGHAGVGCYSWGSGTVTYVMMVNDKNAAEIYWRDTNTTLKNTTTHPINVWVKSPAEIKNVNPATSLGYTNYFYAQLDDNYINGYNISWAAENTTIISGSKFQVGEDRGISGTHLSVTAIPNQGGGNSILVFFQTLGSDITEWTRDWLAGQWTSVDISIPKH